MNTDQCILESKADIRRFARPACAALVAAISTMSGCTMLGFMAESYQRSSTHEIPAEYVGLEGKSFVVVVTADRIIQADHPGLIDRLTAKLTERLSTNTNVPRAAGYVPADKVLRYLYDNPTWHGKPLAELAQSLGGVDRLILVEVNEYRLNDPGNAYEWDGVAAGSVGVVDTSSANPDEFVFEKAVSVKFPDKKGFDPNNTSRESITSVLSSRFIDRVSWLFYNHEEPYYPDY